ncbi:MAG: Carbon storage regulator [Firmicutes bacterium]|nr:Carbon storage regulator [Bacillota bacterium]MDI6707458.1 carbon storage regulator CsrA [Bacillota bacterium]
MLVLTRKIDESIVIGDDIVIKVVSVEDGKVKLGISAPKDMSIHRHEVYRSIQEENREAVVNKEISIKDLDSILKVKKTSEDD